MPSERIQRQIDDLLDEAEQALKQGNWKLALELSHRIIVFDPENADAKEFISFADRGLSSTETTPSSPTDEVQSPVSTSQAGSERPSFGLGAQPMDGGFLYH